SAQAQIKMGVTLKVAFPYDITSIDGAYSGSAQDVLVIRVIADTLVGYDQKSQLFPLLATAWEQPDPTTWVFHLRNGVKYHDGTTFDAAGAKAFLDNTRSTTSGSTQASDLAIVTSIDVPDHQRSDDRPGESLHRRHRCRCPAHDQLRRPGLIEFERCFTAARWRRAQRLGVPDDQAAVRQREPAPGGARRVRPRRREHR